MHDLNYEPHELAMLFPRADAADTKSIEEDIIRYGCRVPIVLYEGKILDGWTRFVICQRFNKKPLFRPFVGSRQDAIAHVTSLNLCRRHLTQPQKAAVAARLKRILESTGVPPTEARADAAREAKVSQDSVRRMEWVEDADEDVANEVLNGRLSIAKAERTITPPTDAQSARELIMRASAALTRSVEHLDDAPTAVKKLVFGAIQSAEKALDSTWFKPVVG